MYNGYVENDDENLIKSVKVFFYFYFKFQELRFRRMLYRWRINSFYAKNNEGGYNVSNTNNRNSENIPISLGNYNSMIQVTI